MTPKLEIACFNLESALIAAKAGADRIELCTNFKEGGTTPDLETVKEALHRISIPIFIMIRPRGGNFIYSIPEFEQMKKEISLFKSIHVAGFVFGILDKNDSIDTARNSELVELASPLPCTFHRAFDQVPNYKTALEHVVNCGFKAILSSGLSITANDGFANLNKLIQLAKKRIAILPGGGIRSQNILNLLITKTEFYHSSAIIDQSDLANENEIKALKNCLIVNEIN